MDGFLALDLLDMVIEVLRIQETGATFHSKTKTQNVKRRQKIEQLNGVDYVPSNAHSSPGESQLYIVEDNEDVIKTIQIIKNPQTF